MEEAALSPGVGVTEAPETTMPGEPRGAVGKLHLAGGSWAWGVSRGRLTRRRAD